MKLMCLYFDAVSHSACWVAERVHISFDLFGRKILRSGDLSSMLGCARNNSFEHVRGYFCFAHLSAHFLMFTPPRPSPQCGFRVFPASNVSLLYNQGPSAKH